MSTSTKAAKATTITKREAQARWSTIVKDAVEAYGSEREAKLALGRILVEAETIGARANLTAKAIKDGASFDAVDAVREAIEARYGSAPSTTALHYLKRFAIVVDLMETHKVGTVEQRETITEGAARAIPAKLSEAKAVAALGVATKGGGKVTGERVKAGVVAQRSGKAKAAKANATKTTKAKAAKANAITPAYVIAMLTEAPAHQVTKATKAELQEAFTAYLARLT